jgi:hypothetical protein
MAAMTAKADITSFFDAAPNYYGKSTTDWATWASSTMSAIEGGSFVNMMNGTSASTLGTNHFVAADGFVWGPPTMPNGPYDQGRGLTTIFRFTDTTAAALMNQGLTISETFAGDTFTKQFGVDSSPASWQLLEDGGDVFAFIRAGWAADDNGSSAADLASVLDQYTDVSTSVMVGNDATKAVAIYDAQSVPEPSSMALVGLSLAALGYAGRRKR